MTSPTTRRRWYVHRVPTRPAWPTPGYLWACRWSSRAAWAGLALIWLPWPWRVAGALLCCPTVWVAGYGALREVDSRDRPP